MAGLDPTLQNQALQTLGSSYRVPMSGEDLIAQQNAALAAQQSQDLAAAAPPATWMEQQMADDQAIREQQALETQYAAEQAELAKGLPPEQAMSMPPAPLPAEENQSEMVSEPIMSYPAEQPAGPPQAPPGAANPHAQRLGAMQRGFAGGLKNPLPGFVKDAEQRRADAQRAADGAQLDTDVAAAGYEQATVDIGEQRNKAAQGLAKLNAATADALRKRQAEQDDELDTVTKAQSIAEERHASKTAELGKMEPKDRRSMGQRVMGALAVALGGLADQANLAAGLNIGLNVQTNLGAQAAGMIERGIERDLDMQRQMLENKRTELAALGTELGHFSQKSRDINEAYSFAKASLLDQAIAQAESVKQAAYGAEQSALADQTIFALREKRATILGEEKKREMAQADQEVRAGKMAMYNAQQAARAAAANGPRKALEEELKRQKSIQELRKGEIEIQKGQQELAGGADPYGLRSLGGAKPSKEATNEAQKLVSSAEGVRATIAQLRQMAAKGGTLSPTERATARRRVAALGSQFNGVFGDGTAPNEAQLAQIDSFMANPTEYSFKDTVKMLDDFDKDAADLTNAKVRGYGFAYEGGVDVRPE
jgi:hypothetical protein